MEFDNSDFIEYTYTATGTKLRKTVSSWKTTTGGTTDYAGQFLYQDNELSCIFTPVGRIVPMQYNDETFWKHEYNLKDHLGNTRIVFAAHPHGQPEVMQQTSYYPFGMTLQQQNFGGALSQPNKLLYNGKELQDDELAGVSLDWYDYGFRFYDSQLARFTTIDPLTEKNHSQSGFAYAYNNPVRFIDFMGLDTVDINYNADDEIWEITNTQMVEGDDVFRVTRDGETTTHTFSEGEYGERVNMLNLETNDDYTLGVYHVSGADRENGRTGYFVTPGGDASTEVGSGARLPADTYDLQSSPETASWRQIWVTNGEANGNVSARGIKFHFGGSNPADWTQGCFILSSSYTKNGNNIQYSFGESRRATIWMDFHLGATSVYRYATQKYNGSGRIGATFNTTNLTHKLILKDGF